MTTYFFTSVDQLIGHLKNTIKSMGPLRLQKTLYFLYAFYGATYGSMRDEYSVSEVDSAYPEKLFPGAFEAWEYGPVMREVYFNNKKGRYDDVQDATETEFQNEDKKDVIAFLDDLTRQLNQMSDFALVDRAHSDKAWSEKFNPDNTHESNEIDNDQLIAEYKERLREVNAG